MKKTLSKAIISILILCAIVFNFYGCTANAQTIDLMDGISAYREDIGIKFPDSQFSKAYADFAVKIFDRAGDKSESNVISPLSIMLALAMTANGAEGETKAEMEKLLCGDFSIEMLNRYLYEYSNEFSNAEGYKNNIANAIWFNEGVDINKEFLQINANYYNAGAFKEEFGDQTVNNINNWVSKNTDGMIDGIINHINPDSVMYLLNAISFEASWENEYYDESIEDGRFKNYNGGESDVKMLCSSLERYIDDGRVKGFIRSYRGGQYSFVALLPDEDTDINDYISSLTGDKLINAINSEIGFADVKLPEFETAYSVKLNDALSALGMSTAFDSIKADFSEIAQLETGNLFINNVYHKAYISVDRKGTKAAAVTSVEFDAGCAYIDEVYQLTLDRPFVYMIIDETNKLPIFIGTVMNL